MLTLSIEIVSLSLIGDQLLAANKQLWLQMRRYHCVAAGNKTIELVYRASNELFVFGLFREQESLNAYEQYVNKLKRQGEFSWELVMTSPSHSVVFLENVHHLSEKALTRLDDVRQTFQMPLALVFSSRRTLDRARDTLLDFVSVMKEVADVQLSFSGKLDQQTDWQSQTKNLIAAGFAVNALLTLFAVAIWVRSVTARVGLLVENSRRLGRGMELLPQQGGADEIAALESSLHDAAANLKESDEQRREIVAVISHELRSPLTAISSTVTMAAEEFYGEIEDDARRAMEETDKELSRLLQLINELLDISKLEAGKSNLDLQEFNIAETIEVVLDETKDSVDKKQLAIEIEAPELFVNADSARIERVLMTLLNCLINLSPNSSVISIAAERHKDVATVRISNANLVLPPDLTKSMFAPSRDDTQRLPERLSLLLSKTVVEQHYGTIGADSTAGKGTTFWFSIPLSQLRRLVRFTSIELEADAGDPLQDGG